MNNALIAVSFESLSPKLAWVLIDSSFKVAVLLAIAHLTNMLLHRASAAVRDRIWTLAFCGAMILPVVSSLVPQWRIPITRFNKAAPATPGQLSSNQSAPQFVPDLVTRNHLQHVQTDIDQGDRPASQPEAIDDARLAGVKIVESLDRLDARQPQVQGTVVVNATDRFSLLLLVWFAGAVVLMAPFIIAVLAKRKLLGQNRTLTDAQAIELREQASNRLGLTRQIRLLQGDNKTIPMTIGIACPAIVIPGNWNTWPRDRLRFVMLHELAHIKRLDVLFQSIARVACAVYWFNPLAWYALHRMRFDCELACDDQVISSGEPSSAYAGELIEIARIYRPSRLAGGIAMARSSKLEARIVSLLDESLSHRPIGKHSGQLIAAVTVVLTLTLSATTVGTSKADALELADQKANPVDQQSDQPKSPAGKDAKDIPAAPAVSPARDDEDDLQRTIGQLGTLRTISYAAVDKYFRGSRTGGLCFVVGSKDVQKELELNDEAIATAKSVEFGYRASRMQVVETLVFGNRDLGFNKNLSSDELKQKRKELFDAFDSDTKKNNEEIYLDLIPKLRAALTDQQLARLQQIAWQAYGSHDLAADPELAKALELTAQQIEKIVAINEGFQQKESELVRERTFIVKHLDLDKERDEKAIEVLTPEQREKYTKLKGKPFNLALLSLAPAWQTTQPTPQGGQLFQGNRFAQDGRFFRGVGSPGIFRLAEMPAIIKELGLNQEDSAKIRAIKEQYADAWKEAGGGFRPGARRGPDGTFQNLREPEPPPMGIRSDPDASAEEHQKQIAKMTLVWHATIAKFQPQLQAAMTPEQYSRLRQIYWQTMGTTAFLDHDVIQTLAITQEQQSKIAELESEYRPKLQDLQIRQNFAGRGSAGGDGLAKLAEMTREQDSKIHAVLTKEQLDSFATSKGKPFQFPLAATQPPRTLFEPGLRGGVYSIIGNESVQKELGLSADEMAKLSVIKDKFNRAWQAVGGSFRTRTVRRTGGGLTTFQEAAMPPRGNEGPPGQSAEERVAAIQKKIDEWHATIERFRPELKAALTDDQYKRLHQIAWQASETAAYSDPEVIALLAITREQQAKIVHVANEWRSKRMALMTEGDGTGGGQGDAGELTAKLRNMVKDQNTQINEVLTKEQLDQFAQLKGPTFDVNPLLDDDQQSEVADKKTVQAVPPPDENAAAKAEAPTNTIPRSNVGILSRINKDTVLAELGIEKDSAEHARIREVVNRFAPELQRRLNNPTEEERSKRVTGPGLYAEVEAQLNSDLKKILKPEQFQRLQQINWQHNGIHVVDDPQVANPLGITDDQKQKLKEASAELATQEKALLKQRDELRTKGEDLSEIQKQLTDLGSKENEKLNEVLTSDQREKLAALLGKPFDLPKALPPPGVTQRRLPIRTRPGGYMALVLREPVMKELGIEENAPELARIRELVVEQSTEMRKQLQELNPPDNEKVKEIEAKLRAKFEPDLKKLLTAEQFTRVRQIYWQQLGFEAINEQEIISDLALTEEQREQLSKAQYEIAQKRTKLLNPPEGRQPGRVSEEIQTKVKELLAETETRVNEILTDDQRTKLTELKGKPFDLSLLRQQTGGFFNRNQ